MIKYNPHKNIIYRLTKDNIDFLQIEYKNIKFGIWSNKQESFNIVFKNDIYYFFQPNSSRTPYLYYCHAYTSTLFISKSLIHN